MVKMSDIAEISGVSRSTVWAVLNNKPNVSQKMKEKVLATIRETNYQHRLVSGSMLGQLSQMIGVVVQDFNNPFYTELISGLQHSLAAQGYFLITHDTQGNHDEESKTIQRLMEYRLGGFVVAPIQSSEKHEHIAKLVAARVPLVTIGPVPGVDTHYVDFEDRKGSRLATDYLLQNGHRRIACIGGPTRSHSGNERILGFIEGLYSEGIEFQESMVIRTDGTYDSGYEGTMEILRNGNPLPTALLCYNDLVAMGAYQAAHEMGLHIPNDISVIGFDDIKMASILGPPLTTVSITPHKIATAASNILLDLLQGEAVKQYRQEFIEVALVERASVNALAC
jgi:LacI family transcriptional regulator